MRSHREWASLGLPNGSDGSEYPEIYINDWYRRKGMKLPSQNKLLYQTGALSNDSYTALTSGGVSGSLSLPKDLSILNRRGYASTDRKGVPHVFRCKVDFFMMDEDGQGLSSAVGSDFYGVLKINGCQNNWVMRNAAVKWHAARDAMWKSAGIKRSELGAYSGAIRYNYDGANETWLVPIDGDGNAFTGGTWDVTNLATGDDADFQLKLVGVGLDEDSNNAATAYHIGHSYLGSRGTVPADSNLESSLVPADESVLRKMLTPGIGINSAARVDDIRDDAQDGQDNPPYDEFVSSDTNHDITEPVELGRAVSGLGNTFGSVIVDIPFGIADMKATVHDAADTNVTPSGLVAVEVLDIYPMVG